MLDFSDPWTLAAIILIQVIGLASVAMARCGEGTAAQSVLQSLFFVSFFLVGVGTILVLSVNSPCWISCSATLSVMALGAVLDLNRTAEFR